MKIDLSFNDLNDIRVSMKASLINYSSIEINRSKIKSELKREGVAVESDHFTIGPNGEIIHNESREIILLYIKDQYQNSKYGKREYRYHIAGCETIQTYKDGGKINRYHGIIRTKKSEKPEVFTVNIMDSNPPRKNVNISMRVCKNCLHTLQYNGYTEHGRPESKAAFLTFDIIQFFDDYRSSNVKIAKLRNIYDKLKNKGKQTAKFKSEDSIDDQSIAYRRVSDADQKNLKLIQDKQADTLDENPTKQREVYSAIREFEKEVQEEIINESDTLKDINNSSFLDYKSKHFIRSGNVIYKSLNSSDGLDFSAYITQVSRVVENEMKQKIFLPFITAMKEKYGPEIEERFESDFRNHKTKQLAISIKNGTARLSLGNMFHHLKNSDQFAYESFALTELYSFVQKNFGKNLIRRPFLNKISKLINEFRNEATHEGLSDIYDANACEKLVCDIINDFNSFQENANRSHP